MLRRQQVVEAHRLQRHLPPLRLQHSRPRRRFRPLPPLLRQILEQLAHRFTFAQVSQITPRFQHGKAIFSRALSRIVEGRVDAADQAVMIGAQHTDVARDPAPAAAASASTVCLAQIARWRGSCQGGVTPQIPASRIVIPRFLRFRLS